MENFMNKLFALGAVLLCTACTNMQVADIDAKTGYLKSQKSAKTITSAQVDLDKKKSLLLVPDEEFVKEQISKIGYFDKVITFDELEKEIIKNELQEKVPDVRNKIGINNAYKYYAPFIWFRVDTRGKAPSEYAQFILTDPKTLDDLLVAEIHMDYLWAGVNDQNTWYPLFNEVIKYIENNSETFRK